MNEELIKELGKINNKLDEILLWQAVHTKGHETLDREVKEVRETVYDNPGLKAMVQTLWNCKKDVSKRREFWNGVLKIVVAALIIGAIMWTVGLYRESGKEADIAKIERVKSEP